MGRRLWCMSSRSPGEFARPLGALRNEGQDLSGCWGVFVPSTASWAQSGRVWKGQMHRRGWLGFHYTNDSVKSVSQPSLSNDAKWAFHMPRDLPKVTGRVGTRV